MTLARGVFADNNGHCASLQRLVELLLHGQRVVWGEECDGGGGTQTQRGKLKWMMRMSLFEEWLIHIWEPQEERGTGDT
jgi:hypothetical protein